MDCESSKDVYDRLQQAAEDHGSAIYQSLVQEQRSALAREKEKAAYAFSTRRSSIERIGLPQVRDHRLALLAREEREMADQLEHKAEVLPEMISLLLIRVEGEGHE